MTSNGLFFKESKTGKCMAALLAFGLVFASVARAEEKSAEEESIEGMFKYEWRLVRDLNGIQVYMKHRDDSRIKSFQGKTTMKAPDPYALAAVIEDFDAAPEWMHMVSKVSEIKRHSDDKRDVRLETRLPWPVNNRDGVVNALVIQNPENYDIEIHMIQDNGLLPEYPGYVRMPEIHGVIRARMLSNQQMSFEMEFLMDPGGYVPPWISNVILKDISYHSLKKLKGMLLKEKYQNQKSVYEHWLSMPANYYEDSYIHPSEIKDKPKDIPVIRGVDLVPR
jgi:hypothetical protein